MIMGFIHTSDMLEKRVSNHFLVNTNHFDLCVGKEFKKFIIKVRKGIIHFINQPLATKFCLTFNLK